MGGVDREEFVKNKLLQNNKDEELDLNGKAVNDNIIGFDVTNDGADSNDQQENDKTTMLIPPKLPERKKNSSKTSLNKDKDSLSEKENVKVKEKKSSFIKDWQKDLKEFFSLRKKKPSTTSTLELPVEEYETETIGEISNVNHVDMKNMEGNKIPEEAPCDVPSIENIEHADIST